MSTRKPKFRPLYDADIVVKLLTSGSLPKFWHDVDNRLSVDAQRAFGTVGRLARFLGNKVNRGRPNQMRSLLLFSRTVEKACLEEVLYGH